MFSLTRFQEQGSTKLIFLLRISRFFCYFQIFLLFPDFSVISKFFCYFQIFLLFPDFSVISRFFCYFQIFLLFPDFSVISRFFCYFQIFLLFPEKSLHNECLPIKLRAWKNSNLSDCCD